MRKGIILLKTVLVSFIMLGIFAGTIQYNQADVSAKDKGYLILVEEEDGSWSEYENCVEVKSKDKLMLSAPGIAEITGTQYKKSSSKTFTISNGKKKNTYTKDSTKYKYYNGSKTTSKTAAYKSYVSTVNKTNMVEYRTLSSLVSLKLYSKEKAGDYQKAGYSGVLCFSKYNKISKLPKMEEGTRVGTEEELLQAAADTKISNIIITADITLKEDFFYEREEYPVTIHIQKGKSLTINEYCLLVGGALTNDGTIIIKGVLERGICNLINNGTVIVEKNGSSKSGMSDLNNNGSFKIEAEASLYIDRGSAFYNNGEVVNEGVINIDDGGSFSADDGKVVNNGIIDIFSYYNGDISLITGTGSINDHREAAK